MSAPAVQGSWGILFYKAHQRSLGDLLIVLETKSVTIQEYLNFKTRAKVENHSASKELVIMLAFQAAECISGKGVTACGWSSRGILVVLS